MAALSIVESMLIGSGYTLDDLRGHAKHDPQLVALRKRVIQALGRAGYSSSLIGDLLNRNHSSVLYTLHLEPR
jgi:DNA-binding CsgD family transcriptional regulator